MSKQSFLKQSSFLIQINSSISKNSISLLLIYCLIVKTVLFQVIQFSHTVLIQTIQFNISTQFSSTWPYQVLPLWAKVNLEPLAMKKYYTFPKAQALLEPHHQIV